LVRIRTKLQTINEFEVIPTKDLAGAVSAVSHKESLEVRGIECALRSALSRDAGNPFAHFKIDNLNRVLLFVIGGNEEPLAVNVHGDVIRMPLHAGHGDLLNQFQRLIVLGLDVQR
jgi:hypothetical protein